MFKKAVKNEKGLTLVELLAVIVVLAIVAAIAVPAIGNVIQNSKEKAVKSDALQIINGAKILHAQETGGTGKYEWEQLVEVVDLTNSDWKDAKDAAGGIVVGITENGQATITTSTAIKAGDNKIKFTNATIEQINDDKSEPQGEEKVITIGTSTTN